MKNKNTMHRYFLYIVNLQICSSGKPISIDKFHAFLTFQRADLSTKII